MPLGRVLASFQGPVTIYLRIFGHEFLEMDLLAGELHRQESVTFFRSICIGNPTVNSGAPPGAARAKLLPI